MKTILLATVAALSVAAPAYANDFAGFRVEGHTGLDVTSLKEVYDYYGEDEGAYRSSKTGLLYGLGAGYDYAVTPKITLGAEVNLDFSNTGDMYVDTYLDDERHAEVADPRREIELSARAGYAVNPSTLVYAKVGYVNGDFKLKGDLHNDGPTDGAPFSTKKKLDGLRLGVGAETLLGGGVYAKVEYRYTDYNNVNYADEEYFASEQTQRHQVLAGLGIRF